VIFTKEFVRLQEEGHPRPCLSIVDQLPMWSPAKDSELFSDWWAYGGVSFSGNPKNQKTPSESITWGLVLAERVGFEKQPPFTHYKSTT
jgi:hypothetical protein